MPILFISVPPGLSSDKLLGIHGSMTRNRSPVAPRRESSCGATGLQHPRREAGRRHALSPVRRGSGRRLNMSSSLSGELVEVAFTASRTRGTPGTAADPVCLVLAQSQLPCRTTTEPRFPTAHPFSTGRVGTSSPGRSWSCHPLFVGCRLISCASKSI